MFEKWGNIEQELLVVQDRQMPSSYEPGEHPLRRIFIDYTREKFLFISQPESGAAAGGNSAFVRFTDEENIRTTTRAWFLRRGFSDGRLDEKEVGHLADALVALGKLFASKPMFLLPPSPS